MYKKITIVMIFLVSFTAYCKEYTESPYSIISEMIREQAEKDALWRKNEIERLKKEKKIAELTKKEQDEIEKRLKKIRDEEEKKRLYQIEIEKREKRKNSFAVFAAVGYPSDIGVPMYGLTRKTTIEYTLGAEYNRKLNKNWFTGIQLSPYQTGIGRNDQTGMYRGPEFWILPIEAIVKYKFTNKIKGYKPYLKVSGGYPLVFMSDAGEESFSGVANFGIAAGLEANRFLLELNYTTAVLNHDQVDIEIDQAKYMLKVGYIF